MVAKGHQGGVAAGAAAGDGDFLPVGEAGAAKMPGGGGTIGHVGDAPGRIEPLAVGAAEARAARVVDVEHGKTATGKELGAQLQAGVGHAGGTAMYEQEGRRQGTGRPPMRRVAGGIVEAIHGASAGAKGNVGCRR
mgnify:CR=1 FL=1